MKQLEAEHLRHALPAGAQPKDAWITSKLKMTLHGRVGFEAEKIQAEARNDKLLAIVQARGQARESLADSKIGVGVTNGVVRLIRKIASWADRLMALTVARGTLGVNSVLDDLQLRSAS